MDYQLGTAETRFADIVWSKEPVTSSELVRICSEQFGWKKSTTYTVLKRLIDKGLFKNENGTVTSLVSGESYHSAETKQLVDNSFGGSLPSFIAAFAGGRGLTEKEIDEIQKMIDDFRGNKNV